MAKRTTVTIARKMGSGGSYVGKAVARRLGLKYVDREILRLAAESLGIDAAEAEAVRERATTLWERLFGGLSFGALESSYTPPPVRRFSDEQLFERQVDALRRIAHEDDCVIVGYGAAYVLPCHDRMVNIYFHAPLEVRVRRVIEIYSVAVEDARRTIAESDATRAAYWLRMTGRDWACADNYHLCIDTSIYALDDLADRIVTFVERKLAADRRADDDC
jgi:cytidylate kinase